MPDPTLPRDGPRIVVGGRARANLVAELRRAGIHLNEYAETLLADAAFERAEAPTEIAFVDRSVAELGLPNGGTLADVFGAARAAGLDLCPPQAGPYLRFATLAQASAPDSVMNAGRAPSASLTVASAPLRLDDDYPKGFYLRVVDGVPWLRGYRCDDEHVFAPEDRLVFRMP